MIKRDNDKPCLFVLDTNVLMHDPTSLFRFQEHDIFLPMVVLEELDHGKKGLSEVARNVRQVSRFLDQLMCQADKAEIDAGLPIHPTATNGGGIVLPATGRLFFQTEPLDSNCRPCCLEPPRITISSVSFRRCATCAPTVR
jgi:PhoH-like ATPase